VALAGFNALDVGSARQLLLACCDVPTWADRLVENRPYEDADALLAAADRALRELTDDDVARAVAAHPRIGQRASGWSRGEQAGVARDDRTQVALAEANHRYEQRFDRVFLICATGLTADQILAAAGTRLQNDDATERVVVADELRRIVLLRLRKVIDE
jgi:2-oxo-4-hydroxy-4-carboxy-5-ureidoimidazoline decarboxylase